MKDNFSENLTDINQSSDNSICRAERGIDDALVLHHVVLRTEFSSHSILKSIHNFALKSYLELIQSFQSIRMFDELGKIVDIHAPVMTHPGRQVVQRKIGEAELEINHYHSFVKNSHMICLMKHKK